MTYQGKYKTGSKEWKSLEFEKDRIRFEMYRLPNEDKVMIIPKK